MESIQSHSKWELVGIPDREHVVNESSVKKKRQRLVVGQHCSFFVAGEVDCGVSAGDRGPHSCAGDLKPISVIKLEDIAGHN